MPISDDVLLVHGDCFDVMPKIPDGSVGMVFCDLPYAHIANKKLRRVTRNEWDMPVPLAPLWEDLRRAGHDNAVFVFTATQPFATALINSNYDCFRYDLIWEKQKATGYINANKMPLRCHESILVFFQRCAIYNPQKTKGAPYNKGVTRDNAGGTNINKIKSCLNANLTGERHPRSVIRSIKSVNEYRRLHPTQKPLALLEWLIKTYTNPGDLILDPCSGSGTTAIAALNTGRRAICCEKDAGYHAAAVRRLAEARRAPKQASLAI